jgi:hypothetical protein
VQCICVLMEGGAGCVAVSLRSVATSQAAFSRGAPGREHTAAQVLPYFYVPYDDDLPQDADGARAWLRDLARGIDLAMQIGAAVSSQHLLLMGPGSCQLGMCYALAILGVLIVAVRLQHAWCRATWPSGSGCSASRLCGRGHSTASMPRMPCLPR